MSTEKERSVKGQDIIDLVKKAYKAFNRGDIESLLDMFSDDADCLLPELEDVPEGAPYTGSRKGRVQIGEFFVALANAEEVLDFTKRDFIAQGNKVAVKGRYKARIRATSRTLDTAYFHLFTITNGKIQQFESYFDTAAVAKGYRRSSGAGA